MIKKLFLILICICLLAGTVSAASDEISSLEAAVEVNSDGTCQVTVNLQALFASAAGEFLIPLGTDAYDIYASGAFDTDTREGVEYVVYENAFGFNGAQSFSCSYSLPCTMTENDNGQYFTLLLPEQGFSLPIRDFKLTVRFPVEITELPTWTSAYYQNVIDNYLSVQVTENVVVADSNIEFRDHETITMELTFLPGSFDLRHLPGQTAGVTKVFFFVFAALCLLYWFLRLRSKGVRVHPLPAVNLDSAAGELPCQLYGLSPDMASLFAHWGNLGYLVIRKSRRGQLSIEKTMDMGNERKPAEQRLFHALFSRSAVCNIPCGRFQRAVQQEGEGLRLSWQKRMFRNNSGKPRVLRTLALIAGGFISVLCFDLWLTAKPSRWFWLVVLSIAGIALCYMIQQVVYAFSRRDGLLRLLLGCCAAVLLLIFAWNSGCTLYMVLNLCLQCFCAYVTRFGGRRNGPGEELLREILGLRRFLRKADHDVVQRLLSTDSQYFFRMLPYAEMMGLGSNFIRRFGSGGEEPCRWLISEQRKPRTAAEFYTLYRETMKEIRKSQNPPVILRLAGKLVGPPRPARKPVKRRPNNRPAGSRKPANRR